MTISRSVPGELPAGRRRPEHLRAAPGTHAEQPYLVRAGHLGDRLASRSEPGPTGSSATSSTRRPTGTVSMTVRPSIAAANAGAAQSHTDQ